MSDADLILADPKVSQQIPACVRQQERRRVKVCAFWCSSFCASCICSPDQKRYETLVPTIKYLNPVTEPGLKFPPSPLISIKSGWTGLNPMDAEPPTIQS